MKRTALIIAAATLGLGACASPQPPSEELTRARTLVSQAAPAAERHAPEQLRLAREKLVAAEQAMGQERYEDARRLAEQAAADARLAATAAEHERMRGALAEVNASIRALRMELERRPQ